MAQPVGSSAKHCAAICLRCCFLAHPRRGEDLAHIWPFPLVQRDGALERELAPLDTVGVGVDEALDRAYGTWARHAEDELAAYHDMGRDDTPKYYGRDKPTRVVLDVAHLKYL